MVEDIKMKTKEVLVGETIDRIQMLRALLIKLDRVQNAFEDIPELHNFVIRLRHEREEDLALAESDVQELIEAEVDNDERVKLEFNTEYELQQKNPYIEDK